MSNRPRHLRALPDLPSSSEKTRPDLRLAQRDQPVLYRIRVDLDHAEPPIWRLLELRSDLPLSRVHRILQAAYEWQDYHLHRFALGGNPFDPGSQWFLCPLDVEESDEGLPATEVRLDEVLAQPGDQLAYLYDYGDSWELTLRLESVGPAAPDSPAAACLGGERAAPPEDSGGGVDEASLAEHVDDPAYLDLEAIRATLASPFMTIEELGLRPELLAVVLPLSGTDSGDLVGMATRAGSEALEEPTVDAKRDALAAFSFYLDHARDAGIRLTSAGYVPPAFNADVRHLAPTMQGWIGDGNKEFDLRPLLYLREALQRVGLLRKYRGRLLLTRAGLAAQRGPDELWDFLVKHLVPTRPQTFDHDATLLLLTRVAGGDAGWALVEAVADDLRELGYRSGRGDEVAERDVLGVPAMEILRNVVEVERAPRVSDLVLGPVARSLATHTLRGS